jgi:hypothetical protein
MLRYRGLGHRRDDDCDGNGGDCDVGGDGDDTIMIIRYCYDLNMFFFSKHSSQ